MAPSPNSRRVSRPRFSEAFDIDEDGVRGSASRRRFPRRTYIRFQRTGDWSGLRWFDTARVWPGQFAGGRVGIRRPLMFTRTARPHNETDILNSVYTWQLVMYRVQRRSAAKFRGPNTRAPKNIDVPFFFSQSLFSIHIMETSRQWLREVTQPGHRQAPQTSHRGRTPRLH